MQHFLSTVRTRVLACLLLAFAAFAPVLALAQFGGTAEPTLTAGEGSVRPTSESELLDKQAELIAGIERETGVLERRIAQNETDDAVLVAIRNDLEVLARRLIESGVAFRPRLSAINNRLDEIGPAPGADGPPEPEMLAQERKSLLEEKAAINALLGEAEKLSLHVNRLIDQVAVLRRDLFANTLSRRYDISAALSPEVFEDFQTETRKVYNAVSSWARFVLSFKLYPVLIATFFAVLAAAVLFIGGRRLFGRLISSNPAIEEPSYLSRLSVAFWSTLLPSATLAMFLFATYFFFSYFGVLRIDIAAMMVTLFNVIATVYFVYRLARAIYSPYRPNWRLLPITSRAAKLLFWLTFLTAMVTGLDFFLSKVNDVMGSPLTLTVAKSLFATLVVGVLVVMIAFVRPFADEDGTLRHWHPAFRALLILLGGGTILAALLGYIGLARFISQQIVITGAILATMYIGHLSASALSEVGAFTRTSLGRRLDRRFQFDEATEDQLGLLASVVINILVVLVGVPLILLQWGFQWGDIQVWAYSIATEVRIGSISISLTGILTGIFVFVIGYFGTRGFQGWLDGKVMSRGKVDAGVRNSIGTAVGYAGIALAALLGISAAGIDLSSLALVAGALSLGIGFGLQNIVSNFVSGLILLAERPFKVGDWIVAGAVTGTVKKISVRATEVETFQRQSVILPNSELINAAVGNWTHRNKLGRVDIPVGAGYGADPRRVHRILLEIAQENPIVLKNPEPVVIFTGFGESSLNFEIRAFLSDITSQIGFINEVRFRVVERFMAEKIEIPFPQRDLHIRSDVRLDAKPDTAAAPKRTTSKQVSEPVATSSRRRRRKPDPDID